MKAVMTMTMVMAVLVSLGVRVRGQSGPVTTDSTPVGLGQDYFYDDTMTSSNNGQTQPGNSNNPTPKGSNPVTPPVPKPSAPASPQQTGEGAGEGKADTGSSNSGDPGRHAGGGLFFPLYGGATKANPGNVMNTRPGSVMNSGPGPISEDYWDGGGGPNMGIGQPGFPNVKVGSGGFPGVPPPIMRGQMNVGEGGAPFPPWRPMQGGTGVAGSWWAGGQDGDGGRRAGWGMWGEEGMGPRVPWGYPGGEGGGWMRGGGEGFGDSWEFLRKRLRQIRQFGMESELESLQKMYRNINVTELYYNNDPRVFYGGDDGGFYGGGFGRGLGGKGFGPGRRGFNFPYGEYEADEGYWYNGTFYYGGGEMEDGGGGYWYNGTYYYNNYYGEDGGEMMEDGYWYNGTFYYGTEMDELGGYENEYYEDGYWYNGTFHYLPDYEDGYWYNGTFHYVPEMDDGYWYNGTFHYLPEYDEGYWYNGTFYYRPEMEMEGEGMGGMGEMMEDGFYYNGTFYPGEMEDGAYGYGGYGEREGMEMDEGNMMWWQLHHPRWRDRTNDALSPSPGIDAGKVGTGPGWNSYLPGLKPAPFPGQVRNQFGPLPVFPQKQLVPPVGVPPGQQLPPPFTTFGGYPPLPQQQQRQLPRPPFFRQLKNVAQNSNPGATESGGIRINKPVPIKPQNENQQQQQQQQQRPPPPTTNQNRNPFLRGRRPPPPPQQSKNNGYIERNPMRAAMADEGRRRNINKNTNHNNNNNNNDNKQKDRSRILGALGMSGISASAAAGASGPESAARILNSRRRRPPMPYKDGMGRRRGGPPGYRRRFYDRSRRGPGGRGRFRRPPRPFPGGVGGGGVGGSGVGGSGVGGSGVGGRPVGIKNSGVDTSGGKGGSVNGMPSPNQNGASNFNVGGNNKLTAGREAVGAGAEGLAGTKMATSNQHPSTVIRKKASSPLDPYRNSPTTTLGILFASILGFLLIVSPMACLIHKYRQTKKAKKRTFLRRPELGSVDEGIMDAMVRTELGVVKDGANGGGDERIGGAISKMGGARPKGRGLERSDFVKMEEVVRSKSGKSRFGGSAGCWGDNKGEDKKKKKGKDKKRIYYREEVRHQRPEAGIELMTSYGEAGRGALRHNEDTLISPSSSFTKRHDEMRRMVRGLPAHDEEVGGEKEESEEGRRRRMRLREEMRSGRKEGDRKGAHRPYTVVGLMSENEDVQIV